jgi:penicillin-binding protein 2
VIRSDGGSGRLGVGTDSSVERRATFIGVLIVLVFGVFFVRLFELQVVKADSLRLRSKRNSVRTLRLEAPRGDILDRHGRVLATTRPAFGVQVIPNDLRQAGLIFDALSMLIDRDASDLRERVGERTGRERFRPVRLAGDLSYDQLARVESHLHALPGVVTDVQPRRDYVGGEIAAHVLGSIGEITRDQLSTHAFAGYRQGEVIGQSGVETLSQASLRGRAGGRNQVVDVAGRVIDVLDEVHPVPGATVRLTIDLELQRVAEDAFLPEVLGGPAKVGAVVALDPRNGDVLVMVSKPSYDPNAFADGIDARTWQDLITDDSRPIQNRAMQGQYPPGSTYKAFIAAAALEEGVIDPEEVEFCPGSFRLGNRTYRCWKRRGHGLVDLRTALKESCDVYFYKTGLKLGVDRIAYFARAFNFGRRTGIRLGQEQPGLIPTSAWKESRYGEPWMRGETLSIAIGQGFVLTTPLQLAVAFGAIANGGRVMRPRIVLSVHDRDGEVIERTEPEQLGRVPVAPEHLQRVGEALEAVVEEPGGTGGRSRVRGVRVAGKTGTAQVVRLKYTEDLEEDEIPWKFRDHAWFVGYAPVEAPEIVVATLVEHGGHGSSAAAPITQKVLARYFERKREMLEALQHSDGMAQKTGGAALEARVARN